MRVHVLGASGSGTTSLGRAMATALGCPHFDIDDYFWLPTDPPFSSKRSRDERVTLLEGALDAPECVLSGSMVSWGDVFVHRFTAVIFLYTPPQVRIQRLRERERAHYGERIDHGGDMHDQHGEFMEWASAYDSPRTDVRSKIVHEAWLDKLRCKIVRVDGLLPTARLVDTVMTSLQ